MEQLADRFWNFRGSFKIAKVIDVGTQMSLVQRADGRFLLIDSFAAQAHDRSALLKLTDKGQRLEAILNVHPFHTLHCTTMHELFPSARLIGTQRHREHLPELPWESAVIEDAVTQAEFSNDIDFSVPQGADLVTSDDQVHAASVLVRHRSSGIVHVDDTLNVLAAQGVLGRILPQSRLKFHPMLARALQHRAAAADEYARWARDLADRWAGTPIVCAAHSAVRRLPPDGWHDEITRALGDIEKMLAKHREKYG